MTRITRRNLEKHGILFKPLQELKADDIFVKFLHGLQVFYPKDDFAECFNGSFQFVHGIQTFLNPNPGQDVSLKRRNRRFQVGMDLEQGAEISNIQNACHSGSRRK
jgi:hypothetical protein